MSEKENLVRIEGEIEDIVYQSDETGYTVCAIEWEREPVTLVGIMPKLILGDAVRAMGTWVNHPTYGKQFKVSYFEKNMPADANSMLRYLSSRSVRGVGPKLAEKIVAHFGDESFDVIENNPDLLSDIPGISIKKARSISESFREQFGVRNIMMFFSGYFGMTSSVRIYKRWGNAAVDVVKNNPYVLCDEIYGIGFERADAMAAGLGMEKDSPERIRAGLHYLLRYNASANGHCYLPEEKLVAAGVKLLEIEEPKICSCLSRLCRDADLIRNETEEDKPIYLPEFFQAETSAAARLIALSRVNLYGSVADADRLIGETQEEQGLRYAPAQISAIKSAIDTPVTILTGGPGTGKTTIIKSIVNIFSKVGMKIALAAPTGRAAKRMSLSCGEEAKTVHRLLELEYSPDEKMNFVRNEKNMLEQDAIIVDELSMVDIQLFSALLKAIRPGSRLILIGDSDQLPSVGAGDVLRDTIASGVFKVCRLDRIFRQSGESAIVENAHRINGGKMPVPSGKEGDFFMMQRQSVYAAAETVVSLCKERLPKTYGKDILEGVQVISCTRKGELGTVRLNQMLQAALNPPSREKAEKTVGDVVYRVGDKVMQIRNNYDIEWHDFFDEENMGLGVFNGDIGVITEINTERESLMVNFDSKVAEYPFENLDEIDHAFAVTVHKSQGSEYPVVIFPVFNPPPMLATRNLIYTAITRAKKMVILVGSMASVAKMVENDYQALRYTGLSKMYQILKERA